jgi:hypothetical protein
MENEKNNNKIVIPEIIPIPPLVLQPLGTKHKEIKTVEPKTISLPQIPEVPPLADKSHVSGNSFPNLSFKKSHDNTLFMRKPTVNEELDTINLTSEIASPEIKLIKMNTLQTTAVDWRVANFPKSSDEAVIKDTPAVLRSKITGTYSETAPVAKNMMNENYVEQVNNIAVSKTFRDSSDYKKFMASKEGKEFKDSKEGKEHLLAVAQSDYAAQHANIPHKAAKPTGATKVTSR